MAFHLTIKIEFYFFLFNSLHHVRKPQTIVEQKNSIFMVRWKAIYTGLLIYSTLLTTSQQKILFCFKKFNKNKAHLNALWYTFYDDTCSIMGIVRGPTLKLHIQHRQLFSSMILEIFLLFIY